MGCYESHNSKHSRTLDAVRQREEFDQKLNELFKVYDTDHDNALSQDEVHKLMNDVEQKEKGLDLSRSAVADFFNSCDNNHNGKIEREEFYDLFTRMMAHK